MWSNFSALPLITWTSVNTKMLTQAYDMVAVESDVDPFKYAESNQTANSTGKQSVSGSVSLKFSSSITGADVAVTNLSIPINITIPHPPMLDNETLECRYWDVVLLEQRTDGCELVESFTNHSVCACDHLTAFSMGKKFLDLRVISRSTHDYENTHLFFFSPHILLHPHHRQNIRDSQLADFLPDIEMLTKKVASTHTHTHTHTHTKTRTSVELSENAPKSNSLIGLG
jgi:hypothetical protein